MIDLDSLELFPLPEQQRCATALTTGILPSQKIAELIERGQISASIPITDGQIQPSSLDLRLGPRAYRIPASFLSSRNARVLDKIEEFHPFEVDLTSPALLERGCIYVAPLLEELRLPADISGRANPKSTTGRLDVFTRLITDFGNAFERVPPGYKGKLYTEIGPRTFSIVAQQGDRLNQLRLIRKNPQPAHSELTKLHLEETLVYEEDAPLLNPVIEGPRLWLKVDLAGEDPAGVVGYRAKRITPPIDLSRVNHYDRVDFWDPVCRNEARNLVLDPKDFYILASKERVRIPYGYAAEMVAYDPSKGEFRIHYAGFFDPGFGYGDDVKGTHAVLEVRSHEVPFLLEDGQIVAALEFHRLLDVPTKIYGQGIGSSYQHQRLALSKHFKR